MLADWEMDSEGVFVDISGRESQEVFVDSSRRDLLHISTTEEKNDTTWYFSADVTTETAAQEEAGIPDGSNGCSDQSAKNKIWYFPSDQVEHIYEVNSQDSVSHCENMAEGTSQDQTYENELFLAEMQGGEKGETEEDTMSSLDNLAVLLGDPPRKKSVWEYFDLIAKNRPLAEYIEEREIRRKGVRKEPVFSGHISRSNSKRKAQKKLKCDSPFKEKKPKCDSPFKEKKPKCDSPIKDTPKMAKTMSKRKNLMKPDVVKQLFQADKLQASSVQNRGLVPQNNYPNNNIGDDISRSDPSRCITATHSKEQSKFKVKLSNGSSFTVVNPPRNQKTTVIKPALIAPSKVTSVKTVKSNFQNIQFSAPIAPSKVASVETVGSNGSIVTLTSNYRNIQFPGRIAPSNSVSMESVGSRYQKVGLSKAPESLRGAGDPGVSMSGEEESVVVINCCENCDFETSNIHHLQNHTMYCQPENIY